MPACSRMPFGVADMVVAFYLVDEPDNHRISDATVTQVNTDIRAVLAEFPAFQGVRLASFCVPSSRSVGARF
jgi:hypothetical protein